MKVILRVEVEVEALPAPKGMEPDAAYLCWLTRAEVEDALTSAFKPNGPYLSHCPFARWTQAWSVAIDAAATVEANRT